ncbi:histone-lysine N-methyltransferase family member SUVH2-like [Camellia sinensis]|uniref:histone-lysine N-methyltransferase family member SUVH2-like n=1 Tax=Camellia sinensis TaxID=4442 RepID=UPI001036A685|nr:histone-lysine N-methyltransferase family member SUVH2-like [Camellia sinensis]
MENITLIGKRLVSTYSCQKSYVDRKRRPLSFEVGDQVFLKISPRWGLMSAEKIADLLYDSLRVFAMAEEEKRRALGLGRRSNRGDLKSASVMRDRGLWMNRDKRIVGPIPGVYIGDLFFFRMELCVIGLHGQAQAGIDYLPASQSSNHEPIATSIIVSGGYEDDEDGGEEIIYTGQGGQDKNSKQCVHQKLEGGNLALERSMHYGIEVRVIRGRKYEEY